ncbi:MAG: 50S ribosomal protein L21 [Rickettsiales bacterium]|nr:50S ribosomal protein L21 [Rickettsiales bacterium]
MFVVLKTGNKQYTVSEGNFINIEQMDVEEGAKIVFDDILLVKNKDGTVLVGRPKVEGVTVEADVLKKYRDEKVTIFKFRRRKNSRTKGGHRQFKMKIKVTAIKFPNQSEEA